MDTNNILQTNFFASIREMPVHVILSNGREFDAIVANTDVYTVLFIVVDRSNRPQSTLLVWKSAIVGIEAPATLKVSKKTIYTDKKFAPKNKPTKNEKANHEEAKNTTASVVDTVSEPTSAPTTENETVDEVSPTVENNDTTKEETNNNDEAQTVEFDIIDADGQVIKENKPSENNNKHEAEDNSLNELLKAFTV